MIYNYDTLFTIIEREIYYGQGEQRANNQQIDFDGLQAANIPFYKGIILSKKHLSVKL